MPRGWPEYNIKMYYASMWFNTKDRKLRAYDKDGNWVTKEETNDFFLINILSIGDIPLLYDKLFMNNNQTEISE